MPRWYVVPVLMLLAAGLAFWASARGIGVGPDSVRYLAAAHSIRHGAVLDSTGAPLTHFPPGYPAALALGPPRAVQVLLFAFMVGAVAWGVARMGGGYRAGVLAGLFVLSTQGIAESGAWLWSEPLAIGLAVVGIALLEDAPIRSALAIGGSILTRYAFGAFGLAGVLLVWRQRGWRHALRWGVVAWLPIAVWFVRDRLVAHGVTDRRLGWHPPPWSALRFGPMELGGWIDPRPVYALVAIVIGVGALAALAYLVTRPPTAAVQTLAIGALAYLGCLVLARCVADPAVPFIQRLMAPAGVLIAMAGAIWIAPRRWLVVLAVLVIGVKGYDTIAWAWSASHQVLFLEVPHHSSTAP